MTAKLRHAAKLLAHRLELFRRTRDHAVERGDRIDLAPEEFWETKDDEALSAYQDAVRDINGERPLPFDEPPASQDVQAKEREALVAFAMAFLPLRNLQEVLSRVRGGAWTKEEARRYGFLWRNQHEEALRQLELARADRAAILKVRDSLEGKIPAVNRVHAS